MIHKLRWTVTELTKGNKSAALGCKTRKGNVLEIVEFEGVKVLDCKVMVCF